MTSDGNKRQQQEGEDYNNEIIVTLRLPKKYYKTGYAVAQLLGFKSFDEYVSDTVMQNVFMEVGVGGSLYYEDGIDATRQTILNVLMASRRPMLRVINTTNTKNEYSVCNQP